MSRKGLLYGWIVFLAIALTGCQQEQAPEPVKDKSMPLRPTVRTLTQ